MAAKSRATPWVRLGDYIEPRDERNVEGCLLPFYGINREKMFMPTVADTHQLDHSKYKVVGQGVFAFSGMQTGRDRCIRVALREDKEPGLISPAYTTFRVRDKGKLLPEYLFIFFNRKEMDRYGAFLSDGSIRSNLDWERFCDIRIPLPPVEVQQELVDIYAGLKRLAEENEALVAPLSQACQAFIVDCQKKYPTVELGKYIEARDERNAEGKYTLDDVRGISIEKKLMPTKANMEGVSLGSYKILKPLEFSYVTVTSRNGQKITLALNEENATHLVSSSYIVFRTEDSLLPEYLYLLLSRAEFDRYARFNSWGSARETFDWEELRRVQIPLPPLEVQQSIANLYHCMEEARRIARAARAQLQTLCPALIQHAERS